MLKIADLIIDYKSSHNEKIAEEIIKIVLPMIKNKVRSIKADYREDVIQDLKMSLFSIINVVVYKETDLSIALFNMDNLNILNSNNFSKDAIMAIFKNKYIKYFIEEAGIELLKNAFINEKGYLNFKSDFEKFNFRNQFFNILNKRFDSVVATFYRENINYFTKEQRTLNRLTESGNELVDFIPDNSPKKISFEQLGMSKKDIEFLNLFIDGNKVYSQTEVAKILGTSQQYISKRIKAIRDKYKHLF